MAWGIDYAWGEPSIDALKKAGVKFVVTYLSNDSSKNLSKSEAVRLSNAGIPIAVVWETKAARTRDGRQAGRDDAKKAAAQAKAAGMPSGRPIYFAVDYDSSGAGDAEYFKGAAEVLGKDHVGVYGGYRVVRYMAEHGLAKWYWQTLAWSGTPTKWYGGNHLEQYAIEKTLGGKNVDYNRSKKADFGQWKVGDKPSAPAPKPVPAPPKKTTKPVVPNGSPVLSEGSSGTRVEQLQVALNYALNLATPLRKDGDFGGKTRGAVEKLQTYMHIKKDGEYGEDSEKALKTLVGRHK